MISSKEQEQEESSGSAFMRAVSLMTSISCFYSNKDFYACFKKIL